jgi:nucleoside phosphorylase
MPEKIKAFVSYAPEDRALVNKFILHLSSLKRRGSIELYDGIISAGSEWQRVIDVYLNNCQLIMLLISPYFIDSDYCYCQEMQRAVERHDVGEARVIPIILRPTDWRGTPFSKLQALPTDGKPVTTWRDRDKAFYDVTQGIRKAIEELSMGANSDALLSVPSVSASQVKKNMIGKVDTPFDVCLVCATFREAKALMDVISLECNVQFKCAMSKHSGYEYYYTAIQNHRGESLTIHVSWQSAYGPIKASTHLKTVLKECNPRFVGMTGVCAGDKGKVKLGDLVVASCAFTFDDLMSFKEGQRQQQHTAMLYYTNVDSTYFNRAFDAWTRFVTRQEHLGNQGLSSVTPLHPALHITPMASVSTVRRDEPFGNIQAVIREAVAIDMEGASFYKTVTNFPGLHSLVVKGVCDYADYEKNDDYHEYASRVSAAYMVCFIKEYVTSDLTPDFLLLAL